ncbi:hypothetical protein TWF694_003375 [Orbilia ellipsospora]|uniref:F-box domain-containing protein n=1 Tax=Orbilia ellipsospora TaxID=2528407 RepID=A0AAV9WZ66_9PEZI
MASTQQFLPNEILLSILPFLTHPDVLSFSQCSKRFRELSLPWLFRGFRIPARPNELAKLLRFVNPSKQSKDKSSESSLSTILGSVHHVTLHGCLNWPNRPHRDIITYFYLCSPLLKIFPKLSSLKIIYQDAFTMRGASRFKRFNYQLFYGICAALSFESPSVIQKVKRLYLELRPDTSDVTFAQKDWSPVLEQEYLKIITLLPRIKSLVNTALAASIIDPICHWIRTKHFSPLTDEKFTFDTFQKPVFENVEEIWVSSCFSYMYLQRDHEDFARLVPNVTALTHYYIPGDTNNFYYMDSCPTQVIQEMVKLEKITLFLKLERASNPGDYCYQVSHLVDALTVDGKLGRLKETTFVNVHHGAVGIELTAPVGGWEAIRVRLQRSEGNTDTRQEWGEVFRLYG